MVEHTNIALAGARAYDKFIAERDRLKASNAELVAALEAFTQAMDMHLGHKHEIALCDADDLARSALANAKSGGESHG